MGTSTSWMALALGVFALPAEANDRAPNEIIERAIAVGFTVPREALEVRSDPSRFVPVVREMFEAPIFLNFERAGGRFYGACLLLSSTKDPRAVELLRAWYMRAVELAVLHAGTDTGTYFGEVGRSVIGASGRRDDSIVLFILERLPRMERDDALLALDYLVYKVPADPAIGAELRALGEQQVMPMLLDPAIQGYIQMYHGTVDGTYDIKRLLEMEGGE